MPLPHFLILISFVIIMVGLTLLAVSMSNIPIAAFAICVLIAAGAIRLLGRTE